MGTTARQPHLVVLATRNRHKVQEIQALLGARFDYRSLDDLPAAPTPVEAARTFAGNALLKATELARWLTSQPALSPGQAWLVVADDSGLEVDALDGAPGVWSARFAALDGAVPGNSTDAENNAKLIRLLARVPLEQRTARFRCVIAAIRASNPAAPTLCEGTCEGRILFAPRGEAGFGYDPLFQPEGYDQSFAELGADVKNRISHRARALAQFQAWLAGQVPDEAVTPTPVAVERTGPEGRWNQADEGRDERATRPGK